MQSVPTHEFIINRGKYLKQAKADGIMFIENGTTPSNSFFVVFPKYLLDHIRDGELVSKIVKMTDAIKLKVSAKYKAIRGNRLN